MAPLIALVHGTPVVIDTMVQTVKAYNPGACIINILDEGLLHRLFRTITITPEIRRDFCSMVISAEKAGADIVLVTGSSFSPCVDTARELVEIPVLKIDDPMAEEAVAIGSRIGIIASEATTVGPSSDLIRQKAEAAGKTVAIETVHCEGIFYLLHEKRFEEFDEAVAQRAAQLAKSVDVIVLAQVSLARTAGRIRESVDIPVLASPELAAKRLSAAMEQLTPPRIA